MKARCFLAAHSDYVTATHTGTHTAHCNTHCNTLLPPLLSVHIVRVALALARRWCFDCLLQMCWSVVRANMCVCVCVSTPVRPVVRRLSVSWQAFTRSKILACNECHNHAKKILRNVMYMSTGGRMTPNSARRRSSAS